LLHGQLLDLYLPGGWSAWLIAPYVENGDIDTPIPNRRHRDCRNNNAISRKNSIPLLNLCGINACRDTYVTLGPNLNLDAVKG